MLLRVLMHGSGRSCPCCAMSAKHTLPLFPCPSLTHTHGNWLHTASQSGRGGGACACRGADCRAGGAGRGGCPRCARPSRWHAAMAAGRPAGARRLYTATAAAAWYAQRRCAARRILAVSRAGWVGLGAGAARAYQAPQAARPRARAVSCSDAGWRRANGRAATRRQARAAAAAAARGQGAGRFGRPSAAARARGSSGQQQRHCG